MEIADAEGMAPDDARTERRDLAKLHNLDLPAPRRGTRHRALGIGDENRWFRALLGNKVSRLLTRYHPTDLACVIGLSPEQQKDSMDKARGHNWTLGQITRLAAASNTTFDQLVAEAAAYRDQAYDLVRAR